MTASSEPSVADAGANGTLDARWRALAESGQREVMPSGETVVCCSAPFGIGGLGRHLKEVVDALQGGSATASCITGSTRTAAGEDRAVRHAPGVPYLHGLLARTPLPVSPAVRTRAFMTEFDVYAAARLPDAEHLIAFNGQALSQFHSARRKGYESLALVSANSHLRHVMRQHARAQQQYPIEGSWAARLVDRNLSEYRLADRIYVGSDYTRDSFVQEGISEETLAPFPFTPDPRYGPPSAPRAPKDTFEIVYVGSLAIHKGTPLLIDAVRRLAHPDLRLRLVGSWGTGGMRRFVQSACAADARISVSPGDPLPHLREASLCVHPAYEDGFGYAPAEALACGVPLLVSEDTGMKDLIVSSERGLVLPTGDLGALTDAIQAAYLGEIFSR